MVTYKNDDDCLLKKYFAFVILKTNLPTQNTEIVHSLSVFKLNIHNEVFISQKIPIYWRQIEEDKKDNVYIQI